MAELRVDQSKLTQLSGGDGVLGALYESAAVLVYPSLYEGFGMPILEAMAYRCPVAAAKTSSIPEAGGDAVEYFDPKSSESLSEALMSVLYGPSRRDVLMREGFNRAEGFSWEKCARATLDVYRQLAQ
jgi:glycosyltransferase involved in cell wall biosynthesis